MNPLTNMKNVIAMNKKELELGVAGSHTASWHRQYKDSAWIFVGGLPYDLSEGDVVCVFSQYGEIVNINMPRDKDTGKQKGFAFICYEDTRSPVLSVDNLNGMKLLGRTLRVDHVENYRAPKEYGDEDEVTMMLKDEGIAPKVLDDVSDDAEDTEDARAAKPKKKKKEKKHKKDKHKKEQVDEKLKRPSPSPAEDGVSDRWRARPDHCRTADTNGRSSGRGTNDERGASPGRRRKDDVTQGRKRSRSRSGEPATSAYKRNRSIEREIRNRHGARSPKRSLSPDHSRQRRDRAAASSQEGQSRDRKRSRSRDRRRSRSPADRRRGSSRERQRSRSVSRDRTRAVRDSRRHRSVSRDRERSRSRDRNRPDSNKSRSRERSRSNERRGRR